MIKSAGKYKAKAIEVQLGVSKEKRTPFVGVNFEVVEGEAKGETVRWSGWLTDKPDKKGKTGAERVIESLQHCGWTGDDISEFSDGKLHGLDRNVIQLDVEMKPYEGQNPEYEGRSFPEVRWVNKVGGGGSFGGEKMNVADAAVFGSKYRGLAASLKAKNGVTTSNAPDSTTSINPDDLPF